MEEKKLISLCSKGNRLAQKALYDEFASVLLGVIRRYIKDIHYAEDVLIESFIKIYTKVGDYKATGSFEGWMKRIAANEALMFLRKRREYSFEDDKEIIIPDYTDTVELLYEKDLLKLLDELPTGYRTIFNLYVIEGYKHKEIAEILDISINTSKSQLIHAKSRMRELIEKQIN